MSDFTVNLDLRAPAIVRQPDSMVSKASQAVTTTQVAAPATSLPARAGEPGGVAAHLSPGPVPSPQDRLRPEVLVADATASSLQTRQETYAQIDRALGQTSAALRNAVAPVDVRGALADLGSRLETRRVSGVHDVEQAVGRVNDLSAQVARLSSGHQPSPGPEQVGDPAYQRDAAIQALSRLTGATLVTPIPGGEASAGANSGAKGGAAAPDRPGPVALAINGYPLVRDGVAHPLGVGRDDAGRVVVTGPQGAPVPFTSGLIGGHLQVVNDILPQVIRGISALSAVVGGVDEMQAPQAVGSGLDVVAAQARAGQAAPAVAAFLDSVRAGGVLQPTASQVSGYLGAVDAADDQRRAAMTSSLQQVNHLVARLGTAADVLAAQAGTEVAATVSSSAPEVATAVITGEAPLGSVSFSVLSAAGPAAVVSEREFIIGAPLAGAEPMTFGLLGRDERGAPAQSVFTMGPGATISDVVGAINNSNAGVRATLSTIAAGTVQLSLISLRTGRFSEVTVTNGQHPPTASTILGRFHRLIEARDTVLRVDTGPQAGSMAVATSPTVSGLLDGVTVSVHKAAPETVVTVTTSPDAQALGRQVDGVVNSAAGVLAGVWQATQAGGPLAGDRMLSDMAGRIVGAISGVPPVRGMPGLDVRGGGMAFDKDAFLQAFTKDPQATQAQVGTSAARVASVAGDAADPLAGYLAARLAAMREIPRGYRAHQAAPEERLNGRVAELQRRGVALQALLGHLSDQGDWLRGEQLRTLDAVP